MTDQSTPIHKQILSSLETNQKIRRIAFEIYEQNFEEKGIIIAGIDGEGYEVASRLVRELNQISPLEVTLLKLNFDKNLKSQSEILFDDPTVKIENKVVVVVDDVLNTGRTLAFSLNPFLKVQMKKVQVAVLVDRSHHLFPIHADYVGYTLSTTLTEHIKVVLSGADDTIGVFLN